MDATPSHVDDLSSLIEPWPVERAALGLTSASGTIGLAGDTEAAIEIASVSKMFVGYTALVALEEGSFKLDDEAGPPGSTVRHLLSHASGIDFDERKLVNQVEARRVYSNAGIEVFCEFLSSRTGLPYTQYQAEAVLGPLGLTRTELIGSPAHGMFSTIVDLLTFARELLQPKLVHRDTLAAARQAQFPHLEGVLPGVGRFVPNPWGLAFELRNSKAPHWTGTKNSVRTFGHFGGRGTFLWIDPDAGLACAGNANREFGEWALDVWPKTSDALLRQYAGAIG